MLHTLITISITLLVFYIVRKGKFIITSYYRKFVK